MDNKETGGILTPRYWSEVTGFSVGVLGLPLHWCCFAVVFVIVLWSVVAKTLFFSLYGPISYMIPLYALIPFLFYFFLLSFPSVHTYSYFMLYAILQSLLLSHGYCIIFLVIRIQLNLQLDFAANCYLGSV